MQIKTYIETIYFYLYKLVLLTAIENSMDFIPKLCLD